MGHGLRPRSILRSDHISEAPGSNPSPEMSGTVRQDRLPLRLAWLAWLLFAVLGWLAVGLVTHYL